MKIKLLLGLTWLFACQEVKTIEPITVMIVGGTVMTVRAFSKTTTGKLLIGYAVGRAAATPAGKYLFGSITPAGKYLLGSILNRAGLMLQGRAQSRRAEVSATLEANLLAMKNRMAALMSGSLKPAGVQAQETVRATFQAMSGSSENPGVIEALRKFRKDLAAAMKENLAAARNGTGAFRARPATPENAAGAGSDVHINLNQTNISQALHVAPGATFVHADAATAGEYAKKQFWKGAFFGGAVGAGAMAWWDKKREERAMYDFFDKE